MNTPKSQTSYVDRIKEAMADGIAERLQKQGIAERTLEDWQRRLEAEAPVRFNTVFPEVLEKVKRTFAGDVCYSQIVPLMLVEPYEFEGYDERRCLDDAYYFVDDKGLKLAAYQIFQYLKEAQLKPSLQWQRTSLETKCETAINLYIVITVKQ